MTRPVCSTTMRSKLRTVDSRCAMAMTVRPRIRRPNASRIISSEFAVERRGGLVEQQQRRVLEERARDGDALALAAGEFHAALADDGAHAGRQLFDEVAARRDRSFEHLVVGRVRPAVADVLHDRAMEHRNVLRHDADGLAQAVLRDARDVLPVDQNAAALHVVEALQQREQRRLAAAGMADQADALARPEAERRSPRKSARRRRSGN